MSEHIVEVVQDLLVARTTKALPADKFSTKPADKPKGDGKTYDAIMITPQLKIKVETKGSLMKLGCDLKLIFSAIKTPVLKNGNLLGQASSNVLVEDRASGDKGIEKLTDQALDAVVAPLVKKVLSNPHFVSYGQSLNLPL